MFILHYCYLSKDIYNLTIVGKLEKKMEHCE